MRFKASFLTRLVLACALVGIGIVAPAVAQSHRQLSSRVRHPLVGSWLVTDDVQAFGVPISILLSFGHDGLRIETESPAPTPVGSLGVLMLSNSHGAWVPHTGGGPPVAHGRK
jgi:hypothetical protein